MRALMLTPDERHLDRRIVQEAASLARQGWAVDVYPAVDRGLTYGGELADSVRLVASRGAPPSVGPRRRALRSLRRAVGPVLPAVDRAVEAVRYRLQDRARAIQSRNLANLRSDGPYDLVFAHDVPVFPLAESLAREWNAPLVCDLHEIFPEQDEHFTTETARAYWRGVESAGIAAAHGIICVNDAVKEYVVDRYAPSAPIVVIHNSMPYVSRQHLAGPSIRDVYPIPRDRQVMLFAGSLRPYANLEMVIRGFAAARLDGWVLAVLGDGPLREALDRLVVESALGRTVFLGHRAPESDLLAVTASADIGLLPYQAVGINHTIATPNKLFEYIQARVPIATSRLPMIERIVAPAGVGGFVDYSSAESTAADLHRFTDDVLPAITERARDDAALRYSWEREEPALFEVVDAAMRLVR